MITPFTFLGLGFGLFSLLIFLDVQWIQWLDFESSDLQLALGVTFTVFFLDSLLLGKIMSIVYFLLGVYWLFMFYDNTGDSS